MKTTTVNSALSLLHLAGAASPALSQVTHSERTMQYAQSQHRLAFVSATDLFDSAVHNSNGTEIGEVDDFVIERGSGRLSHVIVRHGGLFGFGGDRVAVPVNSFSMNSVPPYVSVEAGITSEMISNSDHVRVKDWIDIDSAGEEWLDLIESSWENTENRGAKTDPIASAIKNGKKSTIQGTITRVERFDDSNDTEHVAVHVDTKKGATRRVVFGPSWYIMSQASAPMRGVTIHITAYELPRDTQNTFVATSYEFKNSNSTLRDTNGLPRWKTEQSNPTARASAMRSSTFLSDLMGMDAQARWDDAGSIEGVIVELNSARVAMLTLDPDENFLGIADDLRTVPWSITSMQNNKVVIDATRKMLVGNNHSPSDITMLSRQEQLRPVYGSYGVQEVQFTPRKNAKATESSSAMTHRGDRTLLNAFKDGKPFSLSGAVQGTSTDTLTDTVASMRTVRIKTTNGMKTVVLGPDWFISNQSWKLRNGDQITVTGKTASLNGKPFHFAQTIDLPGPRSVTLWTDGSPRWTTN